MKRFFVVITALPLCTNLAFAAPGLNEAAEDVCKCLKAPQNHASLLMELAGKAQASGDTSELMSAQGDMKGIIEESSQCFAALSEKYPEIDKSEDLQQKVMTTAQKQCPDPVSQVSMK